MVGFRDLDLLEGLHQPGRIPDPICLQIDHREYFDDTPAIRVVHGGHLQQRHRPVHVPFTK